MDRNLWGVSLYLHDLQRRLASAAGGRLRADAPPEKCPDEPAEITIGFDQGVPCSLNGTAMELLPLVRELNQLGGLHGIGRSDVVEDRMLGIKSREFYEAPTPTLLLAAHRDLESLVHSREMIQLREPLSRRYAELVYMGHGSTTCAGPCRAFFQESQRNVTGEVRLKLYKGSLSILGRRSPHSLYDSRLASQTNLEFFDNQWAQGFISLWTLPVRMAATRGREKSQEARNRR